MVANCTEEPYCDPEAPVVVANDDLIPDNALTAEGIVNSTRMAFVVAAEIEKCVRAIGDGRRRSDNGTGRIESSHLDARDSDIDSATDGDRDVPRTIRVEVLEHRSGDRAGHTTCATALGRSRTEKSH